MANKLLMEVKIRTIIDGKEEGCSYLEGYGVVFIDDDVFDPVVEFNVTEGFTVGERIKFTYNHFKHPDKMIISYENLDSNELPINPKFVRFI